MALISGPAVIVAQEPTSVPLDPSGYFVIIPRPECGDILVEHYGYDNALQHVIVGDTARSLYSTVVARGWISDLGHAAYLGKELARAQMALQSGARYVQDGA